MKTKPGQWVLKLERVSKGFGAADARREVLRDVDLAVAEGELVAIVGFSGSGKSTLVNLLAGLEMPDQGKVTFHGERVEGPGPERAVVFQTYALLPWLTVRGNVALAAKATASARSAAERNASIERSIALVGLTAAADRRPRELSGGMRQRVALARALVMNPRVLLMDEPLGALDALTRAKLQDEIIEIWQREKQTIVMITNDVDEAILLADRIIPLNPGPRATLGPAFTVNLERPRDRTAINHDPAFRSVRNAVTEYLLDVGRASGPRCEQEEAFEPLPDLEPVQVGGAA
jgi:nitrate/nitrite transport system ATP-binding protein